MGGWEWLNKNFKNMGGEIYLFLYDVNLKSCVFTIMQLRKRHRENAINEKRKRKKAIKYSKERKQYVSLTNI